LIGELPEYEEQGPTSKKSFSREYQHRSSLRTLMIDIKDITNYDYFHSRFSSVKPKNNPGSLL
jgi:hypothetical protein